MKYEKIISTLSKWGYNKGEFEEIISTLASDEENISYAEADVENERIRYRLELTKKGVETYQKWCKENGFTPFLSGKLENVLEFEDENEDSVKNTMAEWGEDQGN